MDWANIQFVPSRLGSTVAATQFLPIDLSASGAITPREAASLEYEAASGAAPRQRGPLLKREAGITTRRKRDELGSRKEEERGGEGVNLFCGVVAVTEHKRLGIS